jgi:hypothetical protein
VFHTSLRPKLIAVTTALILGALSTPAQSQSEELNRSFSQMIAAGKVLESNRFADVAAIPVPKTSVFDIPFTDGNATYPSPDSDAFYAIEGSVIRFIFSPESVSAYPDKAWNVTVYRKAIPRGFSSGQNAFGVSRKIALQENQIGKIQVRQLPDGMGYPGMLSSRLGPKNTYWHEFPITGSQSKSLIKDIVIRVEAVWLGDNFNPRDNCSSSSKDATLDHPTYLETYECIGLAAIAKISFVNKLTGETIASWPASE